MKVRTVIIVLCLVLVSSVTMLDVDAGGSRVTPSAPNSVAAEPDNNMVRVSWDYPTGFTGADLLGFTIKRGTTSGSVNSIVANLGPFALSFPDDPLTNGVTYYYTVSAINDEGSGTPSDPVSAIPRGPSSKPKNFTASYGSNFIHLSWKSPADPNGSPLSGYSVFKGYKENNISIRNDVGMDLEFMDSGLINGKTYYYQVLAITEHGDGIRSEKMILSPKTTPSAPFNITLTSGDEKVHITWNHSLEDGGAFVQKYGIFRGTVSDNLSKVGQTQESTETSFTDIDVENGILYYYSVAGYNVEGAGERSLVQTVTPLGPPAKPMNMTLIPGNANITIVWKAPEFDGGTEILGYRIYMRTYDQNEMTMIDEIGDMLSYKADDLTNGEIHYFQVKAFNEVGEGPGTTAELIRPEPMPKTPENFKVQDNEGKVKLVWSKPTYTGEYDYEFVNIYRGTDENDLILLDNTSAEFSYYFDENVEIGVAYYYEVSITSEIGEGLRTPQEIGRPYGRPSVPNNFAVVSRSEEATLTWTHPDENGGRIIANFKIFRGTDPETLTQLVDVLGTDLIYNDTGLKDGRTYYYRISAVNMIMEGNSTEIISVTPIGPPDNPLAPKGNYDPVNKTISISWSNPSNNGGVNISTFKVYKGTETNNLTFYMEIEAGEEFIDDNVEDGMQYFYKISAVNNEGEGGYSIEFSVTIPVKESKAEDNSGSILIWVILAIIVVILMIALIGFAVYQSNQKNKKEEESDAPELEESESEREERLILERRKMMGEFTDVALNTEMAHEGDHEQHNLSYEDLYGSSEKNEGDNNNLQGDQAAQASPEQQIVPQEPAPVVEAAPEVQLPPEPQQEAPPVQQPAPAPVQE